MSQDKRKEIEDMARKLSVKFMEESVVMSSVARAAKEMTDIEVQKLYKKLKKISAVIG